MHRIKNGLLILAGTFLMAVATTSIYVPANLVTGGFSGIGIVVKRIASMLWAREVPVWLTIFVLNIILFGFAFMVMGKKYVARSMVAAVLYNIFTGVIPNFGFYKGDMLLAVVYGGVIMGVGIAFILMADVTTGGSDMTAAIIQRKIPRRSVPELLFIVDGIIVILGAAVFGINMAMYAAVAIYITTIVSDRVIEGPKRSKAVYIISEHDKIISEQLLTKLDRGVTGIYGRGMYSGNDKNILLCIVTKKELNRVKDIVLKADNKAFFMICDVTEVLGEGFSYKSF